MANPTYISNFELVDDVVDYEYRNKSTIIGGANLIVTTQPERRYVRTKTYMATIKDGVNEIPAPSYQAGNSYITANPENLSPVGNNVEQWHCDNVTYSKGLSQPCSRQVKVVWVYKGAWVTYSE